MLWHDAKVRRMDALQEQVFAFLGDPATHGVAQVRRCDTHAAAVFLAGDIAFKVKRAVRFPFLDYSTLAKRRAACLAELEVNRRFAPQLYRRVVAITRAPGGRLAIGGDGETVEWAVEMARFDENDTLDRIAARGALDACLPARLATSVVAMHAAAERVDAAPWIAALDEYVEQNAVAFRGQAALFATPRVAELARRSRAALRRLRPLLAARGRRGLVRRGHGDLHLGNIVLIDGAPVAFDAIEFDPVVASGDVLYDLAFLLMDLAERGLADAANAVLNGYFAALRCDEDYDGLAALPFFMSLRAAIRAKVTASRLADAAAAEKPAIAAAAARYFALALDLLAPAPAVVVCTGGLSGTGKTALARALAPCLRPRPGALVLRSDVMRKAMFGVGETERLPPPAYASGVSAQIYGALADKAGRIARAGASVIVDAVFARADERAAIESVARGAGVVFWGLFLTADLETRLRRIGGRGADASDADAAVARQQEDYAVGAMTWNVVDASGTAAATLALARACLEEKGLLVEGHPPRGAAGCGG